ncbi:MULTISPECIES: nuclear transport factor 2 family protein [Streptomyces]|uniref:nuclear transport factor 2 family protein n=1 Tax=Streptomyces TaxID=1883 RepID=UPI00037908EA|nr:nuclear transport factor 2 family protein [Streptomyces xiaopingdaonensis]
MVNQVPTVPAEDRAAIQELILARARAVDDGDRDAFCTLLQDATFVAGPHQVTGAAIARLIEAGPQPTRHLVTNHRFRYVSGLDTVEAESHFVLLSGIGLPGSSHPQPRTIAATGRYLDRFARQDGRWSTTRHEVLVDP